MKTIRIKNNGVVTIADKLLEDLVQDGVVYNKHLCSGGKGNYICKNALANKCPKVADLKKKNISKYDFITDGYQVIEEDGEMSKFIVNGCENFEKELNVTKKHSMEKIMAINEAKLNLMLNFFNVDTVREVEEIVRHNNKIK